MQPDRRSRRAAKGGNEPRRTVVQLKLLAGHLDLAVVGALLALLRHIDVRARQVLHHPDRRPGLADHPADVLVWHIDELGHLVRRCRRGHWGAGVGHRAGQPLGIGVVRPLVLALALEALGVGCGVALGGGRRSCCVALGGGRGVGDRGLRDGGRGGLVLSGGDWRSHFGGGLLLSSSFGGHGGC